jgi:hypothetical protein
MTMSDTPFHQTRMGQQYYERTLPEIARQLDRLNELLERLVTLVETKSADPDKSQRSSGA